MDFLLLSSYLGDAHRGFGCELAIEEDGLIEVDGSLNVSGDNPVFILSGTISVASLDISNHGKFTVTSSGKLLTSSLRLHAWTETTVALNAVIGSNENIISIDNIEIGFGAKLSFAHSELYVESTSFKMDATSKLIINGGKKNVSITAKDFILQDEAVIDVSEGGEGSTAPGSSSDSRGASYGGEGGLNPDSTYGSTVYPTEYGSGTPNANGGGIIMLNITNKAEINGALLANGALSSSTGGASGGTILIEAGTLQGHGRLSVNGGKSSSGSGGGGGRIALIATSMSRFMGNIAAFGGSGPKSNGAAGTEYQHYKTSGDSKVEKVSIDNNGLTTDSITHVTKINDLTELNIKGFGQAKFNSLQPIKIGTILGDYTGTLTVFAHQVIDIASSYGILTPYALMCKLIIKEGGQARIPPKILLTDDDITGKDWYNLELYGTVLAVRELTVSTGGKALIHSKSRSGLSSEDLKPSGTLSLNKIDVTTDGLLELSLDSMDKYTVQMIKELNVKYGGKVIGQNLDIQTPILEVAYGGELSVSGGNKDKGTGDGHSGISGSGGSHGGTGGLSNSNVKPSTNYTGIIEDATDFGSAGGDGATESGGRGGGYIKLTVTNLLNIHGTLSADGDDTVNNGGAGSGGGIKIHVSGDMKGSGIISVRGGDSKTGGGGGGGRIYIYGAGRFNYLGDYRLCGGTSTSSQAGGSGTSFVEFRKSGIPDYVKYLYLDNSCSSGATEGVTFIDLPGQALHTLDSLNIADNTKVWFTTPKLHFIAQTLECGTGSKIIVDNHVVFSADVNQIYSAITCSFDLKQDGELRLPNTVELKGKSSTLEGNFLHL